MLDQKMDRESSTLSSRNLPSLPSAFNTDMDLDLESFLLLLLHVVLKGNQRFGDLGNRRWNDNRVDQMQQISAFEYACSLLSDMRRLQIGKSKIWYEIMKIIGIGSRFSQTICFVQELENDEVDEPNILNWWYWFM